MICVATNHPWAVSLSWRQFNWGLLWRLSTPSQALSLSLVRTTRRTTAIVEQQSNLVMIHIYWLALMSAYCWPNCWILTQNISKCYWYITCPIASRYLITCLHWLLQAMFYPLSLCRRAPVWWFWFIPRTCHEYTRKGWLDLMMKHQ